MNLFFMRGNKKSNILKDNILWIILVLLFMGTTISLSFVLEDRKENIEKSKTILDRKIE